MNEMTDLNPHPEGLAPTDQSIQVPLCEQTLFTDVAGDFSLPDYQPEIKRLLRISASVLPPNRCAENGAVSAVGTLDYYVLYMGNDNRLYCAPLTTEYHLTVKPDGDRASFPYSEPLLCLCHTTPEPPVGRVTAPRRLHIRCRLQSTVALYGEWSMGRPSVPPTEPSAAPDAPDGMECLNGTAAVGRTLWGLSDPLPLQDDLILPPGEWRVVCAEGQVQVEEAAAGMGLVNCRGEVLLKLILCPADALRPSPEDESAIPDTDNEPDTARNGTAPAGEAVPTVIQRKIPFSQTVELENVTPACECCACGSCTELQVEMDGNHLHTDLSVVLDVLAQCSEAVPYTKDMYSTRRAAEGIYTDCAAEQSVRAFNGHFTLSDALPVSEVGVDPAARVVDVSAVATASSLTDDPARNRSVLTGTCRCHLLLVKDSEYTTADMTLPFRYEFDSRDAGHPAGEAAIPAAPTTAGTPEKPESASEPADPADTAANPSAGIQGLVTVMGCRARMDGERVGIDAELAVTLRTTRPAAIRALTDLSFGDEIRRRRGEYVICYPAPEDSLWSVAKRYHAPLSALCAANNLTPAAEADDPASLGEVNYLIV